jgi:hypothetical protein
MRTVIHVVTMVCLDQCNVHYFIIQPQFIVSQSISLPLKNQILRYVKYRLTRKNSSTKAGYDCCWMTGVGGLAKVLRVSLHSAKLLP